MSVHTRDPHLLQNHPFHTSTINCLSAPYKMPPTPPPPFQALNPSSTATATSGNMTDSLGDGEFWLPAQFLGEDAAVLKMNKAVGRGAVWRTQSAVKLALPRNECPYEFGFRSDASSPVDSLATVESEEDDFFAELTQRLTMSDSRKVSLLDLFQTPEIPKVSGGSPQSILGGIGSWSGRSYNGSHHSPLQGPSPPATPFKTEDDTWGSIYAAAGQVARMQINAQNPLKPPLDGHYRAISNPNKELNRNIPLRNHQACFFADQQNYMAAAARKAGNAAFLCEQHPQNLSRSGSYTNTRCGGVASDLLTQSAWPPLQQPQACRVPNKVPLQRKESAGTGVFLPRRYDTAHAAPPRKKTAASTNTLVPAKVVQAFNMSFEEMRTRSKPHLDAYAASLSQQHYDAVMARWNAFTAQQQRRVARTDEMAQSNLEVCLPQEWSY